MEKCKLVDPTGKQFGIKTFHPEPFVKGVFCSRKTGQWYQIIKINKATKKVYCKTINSSAWRSNKPIGVGKFGKDIRPKLQART